MVTPQESLYGRKFGRLRVIASPYETNRGLKVNTLCSCGKEKQVFVDSIRSGAVRSCGCLGREVHELLSPLDSTGAPKRSFRREYIAYSNAMQRCTNRNATAFKNHGGKGIKLCERWSGDFVEFLRDMGPAEQGQILVRRDLSKNFEPSNCRWGTRADFGCSLRQLRERSRCRTTRKARV